MIYELIKGHPTSYLFSDFSKPICEITKSLEILQQKGFSAVAHIMDRHICGGALNVNEWYCHNKLLSLILLFTISTDVINCFYSIASKIAIRTQGLDNYSSCLT